jgi:hypothetical protein
VQYQLNYEFDTKSNFVFSATASATLVGFIYSSHTTQPNAFAPFYGIPYITHFAPPTNGTHYQLVASLAAALSDVPARHDYRSATSGVSGQLYKDAYAFWSAENARMHQATGGSGNMSFSIQSISRTAVLAGRAAGGNALGLREETQQWFTMLIDWERESDDEVVRGAAKNVTDYWITEGNSSGLGNEFLYLNDASRDQDAIDTYGAANVMRLKEVSNKYDPEGVMQRLQENGYLLSR